MTKVSRVLCFLSSRVLLPVALSTVAILLILESDGVRAAMLDGMLLAIRVVIPSVMPFTVISDAVCASGLWGEGRIARLTSRVLGIPEAALISVACGNVFGFPIGAKRIYKLYGELDPSESTRCAALASNPSAAFVISGVGAGLYGSVRIGASLYLIMLASTVLCAQIWRLKSNFYSFRQENTEQKFILSRSIFSAGYSSLGIAASISFFSGASFLIRELLGEPFATLATLLLEVSGSVKFLASSASLEGLVPALTAFALSFSGVCAAMQCSAEMMGTLRTSRFLLMKLTEGAIAFILAFLIL